MWYTLIKAIQTLTLCERGKVWWLYSVLSDLKKNQAEYANSFSENCIQLSSIKTHTSLHGFTFHRNHHAKNVTQDMKMYSR